MLEHIIIIQVYSSLKNLLKLSNGMEWSIKWNFVKVTVLCLVLCLIYQGQFMTIFIFIIMIINDEVAEFCLRLSCSTSRGRQNPERSYLSPKTLNIILCQDSNWNKTQGLFKLDNLIISREMFRFDDNSHPEISSLTPTFISILCICSRWKTCLKYFV